MTDETLRVIGELMDSASGAGSFAVCRTGSAENLVIEVDGVGRIQFPVAPDQARRLCEVARPARYGLREKTLLDPSVRDTWEVPRGLVSIDEQRWRETLLPLLETLRVELGLAAGCALSAQLHSMLVYEPGQFFQRHQDSEKADGMIGTLVVTLPSVFTGGELVIEQQGAKVTDQGSPEQLSFVAFYSDCEHEVLPVTDGFRVTLTYNLVVDGRTEPDAAANPSAALLAEQLRAHFTTPMDLPTWRSEGLPATRPPAQLVCLLDHQYSQQGFGWTQLKGSDMARVATMLAAADIAGYDASLALAEVMDCYEDDDYSMSMLIYRQRWERVEAGWACVEDIEAGEFDDEDEDDEDEIEFDEDEAEEPEPIDPANFPVHQSLPLDPATEVIGDLRFSAVKLTWLIDRFGTATEPAATSVRDEELCTGAPTSTLEPHASELEGYMGNEGNNASFWYRRAAVVVRPR